MVNAGRILIIPKGTWSNLQNYEMLDLVSLDGVAYLARTASVGQNPAQDIQMNYWQPFGTASEIATTSEPGLVMPDGQTITIDATGLIQSNLGISDLNNVTITSIANGQILVYDSTAGAWKNANLSVSAGDVNYNNQTSGLSATKVQGAIDEVSSQMQTLETNLTNLGNSAYKTSDSTESSIDDADYIPFYDSSAGTTKKVLKSNLAANVDSELSNSSTSPVQNSTISNALGTVETIGGTATKAYSTGDLMLASTGQLYTVTADIAQGGSITSGGNVEATDGIVSQIGNSNNNLTYSTGDTITLTNVECAGRFYESGVNAVATVVIDKPIESNVNGITISAYDIISLFSSKERINTTTTPTVLSYENNLIRISIPCPSGSSTYGALSCIVELTSITFVFN